MGSSLSQSHVNKHNEKNRDRKRGILDLFWWLPQNQIWPVDAADFPWKMEDNEKNSLVGNEGFQAFCGGCWRIKIWPVDGCRFPCNGIHNQSSTRVGEKNKEQYNMRMKEMRARQREHQWLKMCWHWSSRGAVVEQGVSHGAC